MICPLPSAFHHLCSVDKWEKVVENLIDSWITGENAGIHSPRPRSYI